MSQQARRYHSHRSHWLVALVVPALWAIWPAPNARAAYPDRHFAAGAVVGSVIDVQHQLFVNSVPVTSTQPTTSLYDGSKLEVRRGHKAAVQFCSGTGHKLRGLTRATLQASPGSSCRLTRELRRRAADSSQRQSPGPAQTGVTTSLEIGELYSIVPSGAADGVQTPAAIATSVPPAPLPLTGVVLPGATFITDPSQLQPDTIFDVRVNAKHRSIFTVVQGEVSVGAGSDSVVLGPGDQASLRPGDKPRKTGHLDPDALTKMTAWADSLAGPTSLAGYWVNSESPPRGIGSLDIQYAGDHDAVRALGVCTPTPCDWGTANAATYGADVYAVQAIAISATYELTGSETIVTGRLSGDTLTVTEYTRFTDGSNLSDYVLVERFHRFVVPNTVGSARYRQPTVAARHPNPARRELAPSTTRLEGDWSNTGGGTNGLVSVSLHSDGGQLTVHASGTCGPTPCDWGSTKATAYTASTTSTESVAFSALYDFGFAETLLTGSLDGANLVITSYTRFKDGSDRSNYVDIETLHQVASCGQQVGQHCAAIWTDKSQYNVYDVMVIRYSVPGPAHVRILYFRPDGTMQVVLDDTNDGSGGSVTALVLPQPAGRARLQLDVYSLTDASLITSAVATVDLLSSPVLSRE